MENGQFIISGFGGKKKLSGKIRVNGAKNAALKALAASVLFKDPLVIKNIPHIEDVLRMKDILLNMGVLINEKGKTCTVDARNLSTSVLCPEVSRKLRASIVLTGPVLTRTGKVSFPYPGGCEIGLRPIDLFIEGFQKLGASVSLKNETYTLRAPNGLKGAEIFLRRQSVAVTETLMMAAVLASGKTTIRNAAVEPEIKHLVQYLSACGARIKGAGTPTLSVYGGARLKSFGKPYVVLPDRIEAGSFLILGALCAKDLTITHCNPKHLQAVIEFLSMSGVRVFQGKDYVCIKNNVNANGDFSGVDITTHEYPGFPTDLQAPMTVFLTQVSGESIVFETIFENRLQYVESLERMGAKIKTMDPHRIIVHGPSSLQGREMRSPDLRAGLAFIIAAIVARGKSVIHNVYNIDRGYENIEERLNEIGVNIKRVHS